MRVQLVYTSSAPRLMDQSALMDLLTVRRARNTADGLTGALVYCDGTFMQTLEGPAAAVEAALRREESAARQFPDWARGGRLVDPHAKP